MQTEPSGGLTNRETIGYISAQSSGGIAGVIVANLMFGLPAATWSTTARSGSNLWLAEAVATIGLLLVIFGLVRSGKAAVSTPASDRSRRPHTQPNRSPVEVSSTWWPASELPAQIANSLAMADEFRSAD